MQAAAGTSLQWGAVAKARHPLVRLLSDGELSDGEPAAREQKQRYKLTKPAHPTSITAVALAAAGGGQYVLSADDDGRLKIWLLRLVPALSLQFVCAHSLHDSAINCLELHHPSGLLATAGDDHCIRLWHLPKLVQCAEGQPAAAQRACLTAHSGSIAACCFSSCGSFLASCSLDGTVMLWHTASRDPVATLQLLASSVSFVPGDDCALLVAASSTGQGPLLLDLRGVPACRQYCAQVAAAQAASGLRLAGSSSGASCGSKARGQQHRQPAAAVHPAAAVWLPTSPRSAAAPGSAPGTTAAAAAATPGQQEPPAPSSLQHHTSGGGGGSAGGGSTRRRVGSHASYGRRMRRRQQEVEQAEDEEAASLAGTAAAMARTAGGGGRGSSSGSWWLPEGDTPLRPPAWGAGGAAGGGGASLFGGWSAPLSPASPPSPGCGCIPAAAVVARYQEQPSSSSGSGGGSGTWDASTRSFVYRQGGHSTPVRWLLPLPDGLHVLTATEDGEAKLWAASGGKSTSSGAAGSSSSSGNVCCTLQPGSQGKPGVGASGWPSCRPVVAGSGRLVVAGGPDGRLHCWQVRQLERQAHLPLNHKRGNAAASCQAHKAAVTAVAVGQPEACGDTLVVSGDAAGMLAVRWR